MWISGTFWVCSVEPFSRVRLPDPSRAHTMTPTNPPPPPSPHHPFCPCLCPAFLWHTHLSHYFRVWRKVAGYTCSVHTATLLHSFPRSKKKYIYIYTPSQINPYKASSCLTRWEWLRSGVFLFARGIKLASGSTSMSALNCYLSTLVSYSLGFQRNPQFSLEEFTWWWPSAGDILFGRNMPLNSLQFKHTGEVVMEMWADF